MGIRFTAILYLIVQLSIVANIILLFLLFPGNSWIFLLALIPYLLIFPKAAGIILRHHGDADRVKQGAKLTVLVHVAFSFFLIVGFIIYIL